MQVNTYLFFNGECEAAFKFYAQTLHGKITAMMPHEGTPAADHVPAGWRNKILHASLQIGDTVLMASDAPPDRAAGAAQGFSVTINLEDPAEAERIFTALAEGGTVRMPFGQTFFALRFGMLVDRFGTPWMILCEEAQAASRK